MATSLVNAHSCARLVRWREYLEVLHLLRVQLVVRRRGGSARPRRRRLRLLLLLLLLLLRLVLLLLARRCPLLGLALLVLLLLGVLLLGVRISAPLLLLSVACAARRVACQAQARVTSPPRYQLSQSNPTELASHPYSPGIRNDMIGRMWAQNRPCQRAQTQH